MGERGCGDSQGRDQGEEMQPLYKGYNLITQLMAALESVLIEVFFVVSINKGVKGFDFWLARGQPRA